MNSCVQTITTLTSPFITNKQQVNMDSYRKCPALPRNSDYHSQLALPLADYYYSNGTPLHWAASKGQLKLLHYLLHTGADINALSEGGETALTWAVKKSQLDAVKLLLDYNADVCLAASVDKLPIHRLLFVFAMQFDFVNDMEILRLLGKSMTILSNKQQNYIYLRELDATCQMQDKCSVCASGAKEYERCCMEKVTRCQRIKEVIDQVVGRTISLKHTSRCVIRQSIGTVYLPKALHQLPLPNQLIDYLLLNG